MFIIAVINSALKGFSIGGFYQIIHAELSWYLYAYICFLLMLPFLHHIAVNASVKEMKYYILIVTIFYAMHSLFLMFGWNPLSEVMSKTNIFYGAGRQTAWLIIYPIAGYFIDRLSREDVENKRVNEIILAVGGGFFLVIGVCFYIIDLQQTAGENYELIRQDLMYIPCLGFYVVCRKVGRHIKKSYTKLLSNIAEATFGMFLLEEGTTLDDVIKPLASRISNVVHINAYWTSVLDVFICYVTFMTIILILRKIPLVNKVI